MTHVSRVVPPLMVLQRHAAWELLDHLHGASVDSLVRDSGLKAHARSSRIPGSRTDRLKQLILRWLGRADDAVTLRIGAVEAAVPDSSKMFLQFCGPNSMTKPALVPADELLTALHEAKRLHDLLREGGYDVWLREAARAHRRNVAHEGAETADSEDSFFLQREADVFMMPGADPEGDDQELHDVLMQREVLCAEMASMPEEADRSQLEGKIAALNNVAHALRSKSA